MKRFGQFKALAAAFALIAAATAPAQPWDCGAVPGTVTAALNGGTLTVNGTGAMMNFSDTSRPWHYYKDNIVSVAIQGGVTSVGAYAFDNCANLASVTIGNNVTSIGRGAFRGCGGLASAIIGGSVISIGDSAFSACGNLTSITIPNSATSIGAHAFRGCGGLTSAIIGGSVASIGAQAFRDCGGLTAITIPNSVTSIGAQAFRGCGRLASATVPDNVTSIEDSVFYGCGGLLYARIGSRVASVGRGAFKGCASLVSITCPTQKPPDAGSAADTIASGASVCLYVPQDAIADYRSANVWKNFKCIKAVESMLAVTFDSRGGSAVGGLLAGDGAGLIKPADPVRPGYIFGGWYTDAAYTNPWRFDTDVVSSDMTLYAKWLTGCTVAFDSRGGSAVGAQTVANGSRAANPAEPFRAGYVFGGWYRDAACTAQWDFYFDPVPSDITLYAKWSLARTVAFNSSGGSAVGKQTVGDGGRITKPADPARPNSYFGGWYTDAAYTARWDFENGVVSSDTTLYARWALARIVTFKISAKGDSAAYKQTVGDSGWITMPADPSRTGEYFAGWYTDTAYTARWDFSNGIVVSDTTLYARWSKTPVSVHAPGRAARAAKPLISLRGNTLTLSAPAGTAYGIRLVDARGRTVSRFKLPGGGSFSLAKIPAGRYLIEARGGGKVERAQLIVGARQSK